MCVCVCVCVRERERESECVCGDGWSLCAFNDVGAFSYYSMQLHKSTELLTLHNNVYMYMYVVSFQIASDSEDEGESMDTDQPESFVAHVPVPSQEEVRFTLHVRYLVIDIYMYCTCIIIRFTLHYLVVDIYLYPTDMFKCMGLTLSNGLRIVLLSTPTRNAFREEGGCI